MLWNIFMWGFPIVGIFLASILGGGQQGNNRGMAILVALVSCICAFYIWSYVLGEHSFWLYVAAVIESLFTLANVIGALGTRD